MQGLLLVLSGLGWLLDLLLLVLDLNYWLVSSVVNVLLWSIHVLLNLPGWLALGLLRCWAQAEAGVALLGEAVGEGLRGLLSGLDALQLLWNLLRHLLLRSKEMMQRGLLSLALCGQNLQRQLWEALGIAGGLGAYLVNSLLNAGLLGLQNLLAAAVSLAVASKELLAQICSTAAAGLLLCWTPLQLAGDLLLSCGAGVGLVLLTHLYEVALLLALVWVSRAALRPSPAWRSFQERLGRFGHLVQLLLHHFLSAEVWRRAAARCLRLLRMYRAAWDRDQNLARTRARDRPAAQNTAGTARGRHPPPTRAQPAPSPPPDRPPEPPGTSTASQAEDPWKLLKQQEESKKCVICQDENKTVLLLPCRHLCLCAPCTEILLQQPILQRNCPLCRKMILQTLTVYM